MILCAYCLRCLVLEAEIFRDRQKVRFHNLIILLEDSVAANRDIKLDVASRQLEIRRNHNVQHGGFEFSQEIKLAST